VHYLVFDKPSRLSVPFNSAAKIFRKDWEVYVEADGVLHKVGVDPSVSRRTDKRDAHAVIFVEGGKLYVKDLGSTNGTFVNGVRIEPFKPVEVSPNDTIALGRETAVRVEPKLAEGVAREGEEPREQKVAEQQGEQKVVEQQATSGGKPEARVEGSMQSSLKELEEMAKKEFAALKHAFKEAREVEILDLETPFWRFVAWWFRRKRIHEELLREIQSLPEWAYKGGYDKVTFYARDKLGNRVAVSVKYTAYDLLEYLVTQRLVRDPEARSQLIEGALKALETAKLKGSNMELREYVEKELGISWEEFKQKVRADIEASMERYIKEIDSTDGSKLAKHIYLREHARGSLHDAWLLTASQAVTNATLSILTLTYISRVQDSITAHQDFIKGLRDLGSWLREWRAVNVAASMLGVVWGGFKRVFLPARWLSDKFGFLVKYDFSPSKLAARYYALHAKLKAVTEGVAEYEVEAVREMKRKLWIFKPSLSAEEAKKEYEKIKQMAKKMEGIEVHVLPIHKLLEPDLGVLDTGQLKKYASRREDSLASNAH